MLISDHRRALKYQTRPLSKRVPVESGSARSYLLHQPQTRYSQPQKSVVEVEWPSKNNHLYKTKGDLYIIFNVVSKEEYFLLLSLWTCACQNHQDLAAAIGSVPRDSTATVAPPASNGCNQHSLLSVGFHFYQLTDQWMQTADQPAKDHPLRWPGWLFQQEKQHFCQRNAVSWVLPPKTV